MSRALNDLSPRFYPLACELLARLTEAGVPVLIVSTGRTEAEHAANVARGVSWTSRSAHCDGLAFDLCPYASWEARGRKLLAWDADAPQWQMIGTIAESLGLRWGGRWRVRDLGHVEYVEPAIPAKERVA